jgi:hypothetical protein
MLPRLQYRGSVEKDQGRQAVSPTPSIPEAPFSLQREPTAGFGAPCAGDLRWHRRWRSWAIRRSSQEVLNMIKIRANAGIITQINVFTVPPGGQRALVDVLSDAAACAREQPGWLSASLHMSLDGTRVVNYAQSNSLASAEAVVTQLKMAGFLERNKAYGEAHPGLYEVVATYSR